MKPYYEDGSVTLYLGDCREVQEWLGADVLVTDPPYGLGYGTRYDHLDRDVVGDADTIVRDEALSFWGTRPALVFGNWRRPRPPQARTRLVWDKGEEAGLGGVGPFMPRDEEIYVLGEGWTGPRRSNVFRVNAIRNSGELRDALDHPTPKPVTLMEELLKCCPPGTVADPFAGTGSTLIAARNLGRLAIGVEIVERYCELIATRLGQQSLGLSA